MKQEVILEFLRLPGLAGLVLTDQRSRPYASGLYLKMTSQQRDLLTQGICQVLASIPEQFESFEFQFYSYQVFIHRLQQGMTLMVIGYEQLRDTNYVTAITQLAREIEDAGEHAIATMRLFASDWVPMPIVTTPLVTQSPSAEPAFALQDTLSETDLVKQGKTSPQTLAPESTKQPQIPTSKSAPRAVLTTNTSTTKPSQTPPQKRPADKPSRIPRSPLPNSEASPLENRALPDTTLPSPAPAPLFPTADTIPPLSPKSSAKLLSFEELFDGNKISPITTNGTTPVSSQDVAAKQTGLAPKPTTTQSTPIQSTTTQSTPTQSTTTQSTPIQSTPIQSTTTQSTPTQSTTTQSTPATPVITKSTDATTIAANVTSDAAPESIPATVMDDAGIPGAETSPLPADPALLTQPVAQSTASVSEPLPTQPSKPITVRSKDMVAALNKLSRFTTQYLGNSVIVNYWKSSRPKVDWLSEFEVDRTAHFIPPADLSSTLTDEQQGWIRDWVGAFIKRCSQVIRDFPTLVNQKGLEDHDKALLL